LTFSSIVACNLGLIAINRTGGLWSYRKRASNRALRWVAGFAIGALAASIWIPALRELFRFEAAPLGWMAAAIAAPLLVLAAIDRGLRPRPTSPVQVDLDQHADRALR